MHVSCFVWLPYGVINDDDDDRVLIQLSHTAVIFRNNRGCLLSGDVAWRLSILIQWSRMGIVKSP